MVGEKNLPNHLSAALGHPGADVAGVKRSRLRRISRKAQLDRIRLAVLRTAVLRREGGRCQARLLGACAGPLDLHHVLSRGRGGKHEYDNLALLCRQHHGEVDWPYSRGKLVIEALGDGAFQLARVWAPDKWAARA